MKLKLTLLALILTPVLFAAKQAQQQAPMVVTVPQNGNIVGITINQNDTINNPNALTTNGDVTVRSLTCTGSPCGTGSGGGTGGLIVASPRYSAAYYSLAGTTTTVSGLAPGTSGQILTTGGSGGAPFWSTPSAGSSLPLPGGATNYIQVSNTLQASSTFYVSSGTIATDLNVGNQIYAKSMYISTSSVGGNYVSISSTAELAVSGSGIHLKNLTPLYYGTDTPSFIFDIQGDSSTATSPMAQFSSSGGVALRVGGSSANSTAFTAFNNVHGSGASAGNFSKAAGSAPALVAQTASTGTAAQFSSTSGVGIDVISGSSRLGNSTITIRGVDMNWPSSGTIGAYLQYTSTNTLQWVPATATGGSGGVTVYPATATASFPFGSSFSTITIVGTGAGAISLTEGSTSTVTSATGTITMWANDDHTLRFNVSGSTYVNTGSSTTNVAGHLAVYGSNGWSLIDGGVPGTGGTSNFLGGYCLRSPDLTVWNVTVSTTGTLITTAAACPSGWRYRTSIVQQDPAAGYWTLTVKNTGALNTASGGTAAQTISDILLNDSSGLTWIQSVTTGGALTTQ